MLLTDTVVSPGVNPGQIVPWVLLAMVSLVLIGVLAWHNVRLRETRERARDEADRFGEQIDRERAQTAEAREQADRRQHQAAEHAAQAARQVEKLRSALGAQERMTQSLASEVLPMIVERVRSGASPSQVLAEIDSRGGTSPSARSLIEGVIQSLWEGRLQRARLLSVVNGCADRARAGVSLLRAEVQQRSQPYWSGDTSAGSSRQMREDLMTVEAGLSRLEMIVQRLLVLAGAERVGRNWPQRLNIELVVRAAIGSVPDYQRVHLQPPSRSIVVEGRAVNAIIQVLAELVDNATSFSAPSEGVAVHFELTAMRVGVHVDDSGLAMSEEQLAQVRRRLDPGRAPHIAELSPNQLGLLVVRRAADPLGIRVDLGASPRGGTRATAWIPRSGVLRTEEAPVPALAGAVSAAAPGIAPPPAAPAQTPIPAAPASGPSGGADGPPRHLPQRRRGATLPEESAGAAGIVAPPPDSEAAGHRIGQWYATTRAHKDTPTKSSEDDR